LHLASAGQFEADALAKQINVIQKEISAAKKAKQDVPAETIAKKLEMDKKLIAQKQESVDKETLMRSKAGQIGNIVDKDCPVSATEVSIGPPVIPRSRADGCMTTPQDDNPVIRLYHPEGPNHKGMSLHPDGIISKGGLEYEDRTTGILSHHEVLTRLEAFDTERGSKISGHRGYFLTNDGVDLNQALINYGLNFLRSKSYKKIQAPFLMRKNVMSATAQLEQFDEELYKVSLEA
jgi:seryl-tRNA synthetase